MLMYVTSYLCKAEHVISEHMKKPSKEAYSKNNRDKIHLHSFDL